MLRKFGWYPVSYIRETSAGDATTWIINGAFYDEVESEVAVDDDYDRRYLDVAKVVFETPEEFRFETSAGTKVTLRQTVPTDAAKWDRLSGRIDLPVEIIGAIMTNSTPEPTITAAVDDEGEVHTMVLETSLGLYARYARTWIRMLDISAIEPLEMVDVPSDDLEIYDQADDAGRSVNVSSLHPIMQGYQTAVDFTAPAPVEPVTAGAATFAGTVLISSAADLDDAIAFAATDAGAGSRWYVERRARALGHTDPLPWEAQ
jgi:hypothetical protein